MKATTHLIDAYMYAARKFQVAETVLAEGLDILKARRATGEDVTAEYRRAQQLERECNVAWETLELARRAYWDHLAQQAEQELERVTLPLLATIRHCRTAGRSGGSLPGYSFLTHLACKDLPAVATSDTPVPNAGVESDALNRADVEI